MSSEESHRLPLEGMWRQFVPQGHDQPLQHAFYNVAAGIFVIGAGAAAYSVYLILQPFVSALLWAVLFGSLLHPVKYEVVNAVHQWLLSVKDSESPLSLNIALLPATFADSLSERIGRYVVTHKKLLMIVASTLASTYFIIHHTSFSHLAYSLVYWMYSIMVIFLRVVNYFEYVGTAVLIGYVIALFMYYTEERKEVFKNLSFPLWLLTISILAARWTFVGVPLLIAFYVLLIGGIYVEAVDWKRHKFKDQPGKSLAAIATAVILDQTLDVSQGGSESETASNSVDQINETTDVKVNSEELYATDGTSTDSKSQPGSENSQDVLKKVLPEETEPDGLFSNLYLKTVFVACVLVKLWRIGFFIPLIALSVVYFIIKKITSIYFYGEHGFKAKANEYIESQWESFYESFEQRKKLLFPAPIRGVWKLMRKLDHEILKGLISSTDAVVTLLLIFIAIVLFILFSVFLLVQIQGEGMQLISMGSQLINATIVNNPHLKQMLPDGISDVMGSTLDNAYLYGRDWLSSTFVTNDGQGRSSINATKLVRDMLGETDAEKAALLENQVIKLWDHVYQAWVVEHPETPYIGPSVTSEAVSLSFDSLLDGIKKTPGLFNSDVLSGMVKDNIGTVMSVADGIWTILLSNLSLALSAFTAVTSIVLGGSLSILNALLNLVVFLSSLFYLVSVSHSVYKPVAIIGGLAPGQMKTLGTAVEESVNSVFTASFKMGAFYGMWTWLLHSIFATNIVYIPAVLGALFGAVPLVGTYWAAIPGVIELFWGHESPILALLLMVAQILPLSCVDTSIYAEIKGGGHPYLTGLAVAGGIFCWGAEGAIFGPLVLCILLVVTKMYSTLIQSPSQTHRRKKFTSNVHH